LLHKWQSFQRDRSNVPGSTLRNPRISADPRYVIAHDKHALIEPIGRCSSDPIRAGRTPRTPKFCDRTPCDAVLIGQIERAAVVSSPYFNRMLGKVPEKTHWNRSRTGDRTFNPLI
jgi:hypothetical protein